MRRQLEGSYNIYKIIALEDEQKKQRKGSQIASGRIWEFAQGSAWARESALSVEQRGWVRLENLWAEWWTQDRQGALKKAAV